MIKFPRAFYANQPAQFDGVFELWDLLDAAWIDPNDPYYDPERPPQLSDVDALIERAGHFLGFETKDPTAKISRGQQRKINAIVYDPRWTFIHCAKRPADVREWRVQTWIGDRVIQGDAAALREFCRAWWQRQSARLRR